MTSPGVILYGPPASGKDAVTDALAALDSRFCSFVRLKVGTGRTEGYRLISPDEAAGRQERGDVLFETSRYGNRYLISRAELAAALRADGIPVVHVGQLEGVRQVRSYPASWLTVALWCSRAVCEQRAANRGSQDLDARLVAWDETASELEEHGIGEFALIVNTEDHQPEDTAHIIYEHLLNVEERDRWTQES